MSNVSLLATTGRALIKHWHSWRVIVMLDPRSLGTFTCTVRYEHCSDTADVPRIQSVSSCSPLVQCREI
jgi:hypothetical protein